MKHVLKQMQYTDLVYETLSIFYFSLIYIQILAIEKISVIMINKDKLS